MKKQIILEPHEYYALEKQATKNNKKIEALVKKRIEKELPIAIADKKEELEGEKFRYSTKRMVFFTTIWFILFMGWCFLLNMC